MASNIIVSVIIPIYNVEQYLRRCLNSVVNQTLSDIEIICINDCSTDNSLEILKEYAAKDSRIKIIDFPQNKGVAVARNTAMEQACGEYIGFVDSDDFIDLDFYEKLYNRAKSSGANIVKGADLKLIYSDGRIEIDKQNYKIKQNKLNLWCHFTTCIFDREFINKNNINFPSGLIVGEDPVFTIKAAFLTNKVEIVEGVQYYYLKREESLNSEVWDYQKVLSYLKYIEIISDFALNANLNREEHAIFFGWLIKDIYCIRANKIRNNKKCYDLLTKYYNEMKIKGVKLPVRLLFDANLFRAINNNLNNRRGIFWVAYNLLKYFLCDPRFDVTLYLETNWLKSSLKDIPLLKDLNCVNAAFVTGAFNNYKWINNTKFCPLDYDAYINVAHNSKLEEESSRPEQFYILHDTLPLINKKFFEKSYRDVFWSFYDRLKDDTYCFCVSECTKRDFLRFFNHFDPEKMMVAKNASSQNFYPDKDKAKLDKILDKYNIPQHCRNKYLFSFCTVDDIRKNLVFTVECFIKFIKKYNINDLYFYLGGSGDKLFRQNLKENLGDLYEEYKDYIVTLGYVDDEDVNSLYSNSLFFTFLSLYEGFGIPPLEAMMCGVPVITSNTSSLPEVVGDCAITIDPEDEEACLEAFKELYFNEDLRNEYITKGLEKAKEFSWEKTYKLISDKMLEVLGQTDNSEELLTDINSNESKNLVTT